MKSLIKGEICCNSRVFPGHFYCIRGSSLVELMGHDNIAIPLLQLFKYESLLESMMGVLYLCIAVLIHL